MKKLYTSIIHLLNISNVKYSSFTLLKEGILKYLFSIIISLLILLLGIYINSILSEFQVLLLLLIPVVLSSWYGDKKSGFLSIALSSLGYIFYFTSVTNLLNYELIPILNIVLFLYLSLLINYIIDTTRRTDEVALHKLEKLKYADLLHKEKNKNEKFQKEVQARDEFLSIASHELKTPLTLSLMQIQRALHNIRNVSLADFSVQQLMEMLESIEQQTDRLSKMIKDLSNVSLITTGRMKLEYEEFDLDSVIKDILKRVPDSMRKKDYPIEYDSKGEIQVLLDKVRIEQALTNLVSNAIKYGKDNPVSIKISSSKSKVKVVVSDKGIGIPKNMQKHVFKRFRRAVDDNNNVKGLGVGLYITYQIIKSHKGKIDLKSKKGKGSIFIVDLPRKIKKK